MLLIIPYSAYAVQINNIFGRMGGGLEWIRGSPVEMGSSLITDTAIVYK